MHCTEDGTQFAAIVCRAARNDNNSGTKVDELRVISSGSLYALGFTAAITFISDSDGVNVIGQEA
jgi:hypothetical protein